jgi:hypothetical protein
MHIMEEGGFSRKVVSVCPIGLDWLDPINSRVGINDGFGSAFVIGETGDAEGDYYVLLTATHVAEDSRMLKLKTNESKSRVIGKRMWLSGIAVPNRCFQRI